MTRKVLLIAAVTAALRASAQSPAPVRTWTAPLTPEGHPDLQGVWLSKSATPLERPKQLEGRQSLTDAEVANMRERAQLLFGNGTSDFATTDNAFLAVLNNTENFRSPTATGGAEDMIELEFDNRTSLIVDPPDGRIPALTAAGQQRLTLGLQRGVAASTPQHPLQRAQDLGSGLRCITYGVPRLGGRFGSGPDSFYQIYQTGDYVVLSMEVIHEARIIPLDGSPHPPASVRFWTGDSRGRWEGQTLVVDTTNFSAEANFMGSADKLHLVERFTRVSSDEIRYELTLQDPTTWARPWSAMIRLKQSKEAIREYSCHEGNWRMMEDILRAANR